MLCLLSVSEELIALRNHSRVADVPQAVLHLLKLFQHFALRGERLAVRIVLPRIKTGRHEIKEFSIKLY